MTGELIAKALNGHRAGNIWMAQCPAHDDRVPSLAIRQGRDGRILIRCHAGCGQWEVIRALQSRGIWPERSRANVNRTPVLKNNERSDDSAVRIKLALRVWNEGSPLSDTLAEAYLKSRGLELPASSDLRFHESLKHPAGKVWPAMIALVTSGIDAKPVGIHRTFLAYDGNGKAPVLPQRMMLGPCRGGAVRLGEHIRGRPLLVGEGIETCLAAMQATSLPAWATLSTSGLQNLDLPEVVHDVVVLADGDEAGERAAVACARRIVSETRKVRIASAPAGADFNDLLKERSAS